MSKSPIPLETIGKMKDALAYFRTKPAYSELMDPMNGVIARYQPVFSRENLENISCEEFHSFLLFENNRHWTGLHRHCPKMCKDLPRLRKALIILVDESRPVDERLDKAVKMIVGLGKAVATGILLIVSPDKYGVWNNTSEAGMKKMELWPAFERGEAFGKRYLKVNDIILQTRDALKIDLWTLDALWWFILSQEENSLQQPITSLSPEVQQRFGLERHLHEFLRDNWDHLKLSKDWEIYKEPGDDEAGYEYPCGIGRIDLLVKHRSEPRWLIIELKRNQSSDQTVGQVLRYMGWVQQHLAEKGDPVEGMVIAHETDKKIKYALRMIPNVSLKLYEVEFRLREP